MSEWKEISNSPESTGDYLLMLGDGSMAVGYFDHFKDWSCSGVYATYQGCGGVAFDASPTHWQQLPSPPTK